MAAIRIEKLTKVFKTGFLGKRKVALDNLTMSVEEGEILGYLGANGAGKTTTFKLLLGLIKPTSGNAWFHDLPVTSLEAKRHIGFLPERPYFYDHLTAREFLDFYAQLHEIPKSEREQRVDQLLEMVGLSDNANTRLRKFSRGMLQRIGVAQALVNQPKLVILDEPMAALDPIGRKQMKEIIIELKRQGKTVIYSSHILADVEDMCDRVAIIRQGKLIGLGTPSELIADDSRVVELTVGQANDQVIRSLERLSLGQAIVAGGKAIFTMREGDSLREAQEIILRYGAHLISLVPRSVSLEDAFVKVMQET